MINKIFNIKSIKVIFVIFIFFPLFLPSLFIYAGNKLIFIYFSFIFNFYLLYSLRKETFFMDFFLSLFLWLGFWFKFTIQLIFFNNNFPEGVGSFDFNPSSIDEVILLSSISISSLFLTSLIVKKFFINYKNLYLRGKNKTYKFNLSKNKIFIILSVFVLSFIIFHLMNLYFSIYQKGIVYEGNLNKIIYNFYIWLLKIGIPVFISIIIYLLLISKNYKFKLKAIYLSFFESSISSICQLSRAMIFVPFSLIFGIFKFNQFEKKIFCTQDFIKSFIFLSIFFFVSFFITSELRYKFYNLEEIVKKEKNYSENKILNSMSNFIYLTGNRWVGIEGVMSTQSLKKKNFNFFKKSFSEKYDYSDTFYATEVKQTNFHNKYDKINNYLSDTELKHISIFTPGIIGFLYYSGSFIFVFLCLSMIFVFCLFIEIMAFKFSKNNFVFTSLTCNSLAYHLSHFGYMPQNSYKIILGVFLSILMVMIINKIINKV